MVNDPNSNINSEKHWTIRRDITSDQKYLEIYKSFTITSGETFVIRENHLFFRKLPSAAVHIKVLPINQSGNRNYFIPFLLQRSQYLF